MDIACIELVSIIHPNGNIIDDHTHASHELVYCLSGGGSVEINYKK